MSSLAQVLDKLENVRKSGRGYTARCPNHEDKRNSLSVGVGTDGKILLHCHAGCEYADIATQLGVAMPESKRKSKTARRIVATYDYRDERGNVLYQAVRYDPKDFVQRRPAGKDRWAYSLNGTRRVLYHLPEIIAADDTQTVFVVEGEGDADNLSRIGLLATTNVAGAGKWRDEYSEFLRGRDVCVIPDNDDPGRKHANQVAQSLNGKAASIKILELPGLPKKGDVSDWLSQGGNAAQLLALCHAAPMFSANGNGANGNGAHIPPTANDESVSALTLEEKVAALEKRIKQIPADTDKMRLAIVLRPVLEELAQLDKSIAAPFLARRIKDYFGLTRVEVVAYESDLVRLRREWEKNERERKAQEAAAAQAEAAKLKEMGEAERAEAMAFLQSPRIIEKTIDDLAALGYVGEDANKLLVYLIATSRKQDKPLSATVKSPSAYGKSEMIKTVSVLMPPEDVLEFSRLTPQALSYMKPDALVHKLLIVTERNGSEDSDYNIRVMQSEQRLRIAYPVKDPDTGEMHTSEREVQGPLAYIETTTRPTIHAENATRVFELYLDGSAGQTERVHEFQRIGSTIAGMRANKKRDGIVRRHQNVQRLLQKVTVAIPFSEFIKFPSDNPRTRRDFPRFLETIKVVAFLRQHQKTHKQDTDPDTGDVLDYIEADLDDYRIAYEYAAPVIAHGLDELPKLSRDLLKRIIEMINTKIAEENGEKRFTRRDVRRLCGVTDKFVKDYIAPLEDKEYLDIVDGGIGKGKRYVYRVPKAILGESENGSVKGLTTPDELAEAIALAK